MRVTHPENQGTNTDTTQTNKTTTTTTTAQAAAVTLNLGILENVMEGVPVIYQNHKDVLRSLTAFLNTHGIEYVKTELKYAANNSTRADGFPAFLKRALENGWGTDTLQAKKARDQQKQIEKEKILLQQMEIEKQIEERQVQIADKQRELEKKVQAQLAVLPADEFEKIKNLARLEARRHVPPPKGLNADLMALAKKTLASLPGTERDRIRREAELSVRKILGNTISDDNVRFVHALENKMVGIVRNNFSLTSPLSEEFERRIAEKTDLLISKILLRVHNSLGSKTHGHSVW